MAGLRWFIPRCILSIFNISLNRVGTLIDRGGSYQEGCCVEKFGLRERKLSAVFSILLIFGGLFKAWWTVNSQK
jgi:hypothetical protein